MKQHAKRTIGMAYTAVVIGSMAMAHCGSSAPADAGMISVSCNQTTMSGGSTFRLCIDDSISPSAEAASAAMCSLDAGSGDASVTGGEMFSLSPCDHSTAVGGCILFGKTVWYYPSSDFSTGDFQMLCSEARGTWVTP